MATLILKDTHKALEEEIKSLEKLKRETSEKISEADFLPRTFFTKLHKPL